MSTFCRIHAFYDCPICRGEEIVWTIPVYSGSQKTGEIKIRENGHTDVLGQVHLPSGELGGYFLDEKVFVAPTPEPVTILTPPMPGSPELAQQLADSLNRSIFDEMLLEPKWQEAAQRGLKVHEDALELVDKEGIAYQDAIERALEK